jgi:hypothetical protein
LNSFSLREKVAVGRMRGDHEPMFPLTLTLSLRERERFNFI